MSYYSKIKLRTQILGYFKTFCKWKGLAPFLKTHDEDFSLLTSNETTSMLWGYSKI
jgi:hypothetical protein